MKVYRLKNKQSRHFYSPFSHQLGRVTVLGVQKCKYTGLPNLSVLLITSSEKEGWYSCSTHLKNGRDYDVQEGGTELIDSFNNYLTPSMCEAL